MAEAALQSPAQTLQGMMTGAWLSQSIYAAAKLGLSDRLQAGPKSADELARETNTHPDALYRLLRALVGVGIYASAGPRRFQLNPVAELLASDHPETKRPLAIMLGEEHHQAWGQVLYSLRTQLPAFDHVFGEPIFDYLGKHPESGAVFDAAMTAVHGRETAAMLKGYDFSTVTKLVDVGGGNGTLLCTVLEQQPKLRGLLYDLPQVIERARARIATTGLTERIEFATGSFFESVPPGADAYLMRHIIHDWDEERCVKILSNCRQAMTAGGRVLVVEMVVPDGDEPSFSKIMDLNMLVLPGGKERTRGEYEELFRTAGLRLNAIYPTDADVSVIEGFAA